MTEEERQLRELLAAARGEIIAGYRRALEYGYDPPVVGMKITGDWSRRAGSFGVTIKAIELGELTRMSPTARENPGDAFGLCADILDVPPGHFPLVVCDETGELFVKVSHPIPDGE